MHLFYQKFGKGNPLIILHGLFGSSDNWVTIGRKLQEKFTIYLVDQRNHGRSPHDSVHSYETMAIDLKDFINQENLQKVILLGHSMGGKTAMLFSAMFPQYVSFLIVADISPKGYSHLNEYTPHALSHLNIIQAMISVDIINAPNRTYIEEELKKQIPNPSIRLFILKNLQRNPDNTFSWKLNIPALRDALPTMMGPILEDEKWKSQEEFPVLFLRGERSDYINLNNIPSILKQYPKAQIEVIPDAGHWLHAEQPDLFLKAVLDFLLP